MIIIINHITPVDFRESSDLESSDLFELMTVETRH